MVNKAKKYLAIVFLVLCVINIEAVSEGIRFAIGICLNKIVPSLFVFVVTSDLLVLLLLEEETIRIPPKILIFFLGFLCGFPVGAIVCDKLCESGVISKGEVRKIVPWCNLASPAFVIGAVGVSLLEDKAAGVIIYFSMVLSCAIPFLLLKTKNKDIKISKKETKVSATLFSSVEKGISTTLGICALICVFSAVISIINVYFDESIKTSLAIIFELSNGCIQATEYFKQNFIIKLAMCGFCCGWSGICVQMQILASLRSTKVKYFELAFFKFLQGISTSFFASVIYYAYLHLK